MKNSLDQILTCRSKDAIDAYDQAVDCQLHAWPGALAAINLALQYAPDFALAHSARALILQSYGRGLEAREASKQAQSFKQTTTERERSHIDIIQRIIEGQSTAALASVRNHAEKWPLDALVMSTALGAFGLIAFSGQADHDQQRYDFVQKLIPSYPNEHPWLLTHRGWVLIETKQPQAGLPFVAHSLSLRPANGNAAHVMMHAQFELNKPAAGLDFANKWLTLYPENAMLFGHVHWHAALCEIELGRAEQAVQRLLTIIEPHLAHAPPLVGMTDTTSVLWRLNMQGLKDLSWTAAERFAKDNYSKGGNVFAELHLAMLAFATEQSEDLQTCRVRLQKQADSGHGGAPSALHWVDGLAALRKHDRVTARHAFTQCAEKSVGLGGSHAQRTVIERTLAALR